LSKTQYPSKTPYTTLYKKKAQTHGRSWDRAVL
jgi:hypothetical protein